MTYSVDLKNRAVKMYLEHRFGSLRRIEKLLDVGKSTLHRWVTRHPMTRQLSKGKGRPHALCNKMKDALCDIVLRSPFATARDIAISLKQEVPSARIARSTVAKWRKRLGFTRKIWYAAVVDDEKVTPLRQAFSDDVGKLDNWDGVVSIDESAFFLDMKPSHGYSPSGSRITVKKQKMHKTRCTLLLAVASTGVVGYDCFPGSCKSEDFARFVSSLNVPRGTRLLLDNASIHKTHVVVEAMQRRDIIPTFLPPYTPQWQPVEYCFSVAKNAYRRNACDQERREYGEGNAVENAQTEGYKDDGDVTSRCHRRRDDHDVAMEERICAALMYLDCDSEKFKNIFARCHRLARTNVLMDKKTDRRIHKDVVKMFMDNLSPVGAHTTASHPTPPQDIIR